MLLVMWYTRTSINDVGLLIMMLFLRVSHEK